MTIQNNNKTCVIGTKQTIKALAQNSVQTCYVARDAEEKITSNIIELCNQNSVKVIYLDTMKELGQRFKLSVGAAVAAKLK